MRRKPLPIGKKFSRLTVLELARHDAKRGAYHFRCRCDCGNECEVREDCLTTGNTKSCGCLFRATRGYTYRTHGMHNTRTYRIWKGMKHRCAPNSKDPKAHLYAGKGIRVCKRWEKFGNFFADMGEAPDLASIERIDGNGNYEPRNCVWASAKQQANNVSSNHSIECNGETGTVAMWADRTGIKANTIIYRLRRGWTPARAVGVQPPMIHGDRSAWRLRNIDEYDVLADTILKLEAMK